MRKVSTIRSSIMSPGRPEAYSTVLNTGKNREPWLKGRPELDGLFIDCEQGRGHDAHGPVRVCSCSYDV